MQFSPIVLFVYNRPWHTRKTLDALASNLLAGQSELFVFADGPKTNISPEESDNIIEVRKIVKEQTSFKSISIVEANYNKGLANSIIDGVSSIINKYGKVIVLEDDIITSPGFLKYMNDALSMYESEDRVMHISGYMFPVKKKMPQTLFYNTTTCWGWGTWARAWRYFDNDVNKLAEIIKQKGLIKKFNIENSYPFYSQLEDNLSGKINTWAIKWYASFFLCNGYALHPYPSLTNNIGHDSSGVHCTGTNKYDWDNLAKEIMVEKIKIEERSYIIKVMKRFNLNNDRNAIFYFKRLLKSLLNKFLILTHRVFDID